MIDKESLQYIVSEIRSMTRDLTIHEIRPQLEALSSANDDANEIILARDRRIDSLLAENSNLVRQVNLSDKLSDENERLQNSLAAMKANQMNADDYHRTVNAQLERIEALEREVEQQSVKRESAILETEEIRAHWEKTLEEKKALEENIRKRFG